MRTDRELLELAAEAGGVKYYAQCEDGTLLLEGMNPDHVDWNPLTDDGDALRLAVKLGINVYADVPSDEVDAPNCAEAIRGTAWAIENFSDHAGDVYSATRHAIVRVAAEIGALSKSKEGGAE